MQRPQRRVRLIDWNISSKLSPLKNISQCEITRSNDVLLVSFWFRSLDVYFDRETPEPCPCFTLTIEGRGAGEGCVTTTPRDRPRLACTASKAPFHRFRSCSPNCFRFHRKMRGQVPRAASDPFQQTRSRNPFDVGAHAYWPRNGYSLDESMSREIVILRWTC